MKKTTSLFWFAAVVVLTTVYLISNPELPGKVGPKLYELWQDTTSRVKAVALAPVKTETELGLDQELSAGEPEQVERPVQREKKQQDSFPDAGADHNPEDKVSGDSNGNKQREQQNNKPQSLVSEVNRLDAVAPEADKPKREAGDKPVHREKAVSLEVLKEIYTRHLEALKILNSEAGAEKDER